MKKTILLLLVVWMTGCGDSNSIELTKATAVIYNVASEDQITFTVGDQIGTAIFAYNQNFTSLEINVSGMERNTQHAMHLHMGSIEAPGHHWNQGSTDSFCDELSQGIEWKRPKAGDVGNIEVDENGDGFFELSTDLWSVGTENETDIAGTILFIHDTAEFFEADCAATRLDDLLHINPKIAGGIVVLD